MAKVDPPLTLVLCHCVYCLRSPLRNHQFVVLHMISMASAVLSPAASAHPKYLALPFTKPITQNHLFSWINCPKRSNVKCNAFSESIIQGFGDNIVSVPIIGSSFADIQTIVDTLPKSEKWGIAVFAGLAWIYLTARPGVLVGAIDAYILAPLQLGLDSLTGRRRLKRSDILITDKLGEGSFGVVYSGVLVPKNVNVDANVPKRSVAKVIESDKRFKEKVILKQVNLSFLIPTTMPFLLMITDSITPLLSPTKYQLLMLIYTLLISEYANC